MRTYQNYPKDIVIETAFGQMALTVTDNDHVFANGSSLTVNRVELSVSAHLYRHPDGSFQIGKHDASWSDKYHSLHAKRRDNHDSASDSARTKLTAEITTVVNAWVKTNAALFREAQAADKNNRLLRLEGERQTLLTKLAELEANIRAVEAE